MNFFSRLIIRWAGAIILVSTLLAIVGGYYTVRLYMNLRPDIEELLPTTARSVLDLGEVTRRLRSTDSLVVLTFSEDKAASRRFMDDLAAELKKTPPGLIAMVEYRIQREIQFFHKRRALYMEYDDLASIRDYIRGRVQYEKELYNPLNIFRSTEIPEPVLDYIGLQKKYEGRAATFTRFPDGYYATADEKVRLALVHLDGASAGMAGMQRLKDTVVAAIAKLDPASYAPDLEIRYSGGIQNLIEEQQALMEDLGLSFVLCTFLVTLAMLLYFRSWRATWALMASLFIGTFWTFGVAYCVVGYLNANSAFLGAIVIGNGINFGIIFLSRYLEERRRGTGHIRGLNAGLTSTAGSTWTAALAAGLSYGSLSLTSFRGFSQFGIIGLIGMILCWISAYVTFPAMLTVLDRLRSFRNMRQRNPKRHFSDAAAALVSRFPRAIWAFSIAAAVASAVVALTFEGEVMENDLSKLRSQKSMEQGSGYYTKYLEMVFGREISPVVIMPREREDASLIAARLFEEQKKQGENGTIAGVRSMDDFLPARQEEKIRLLEDIRRTLPPHLLIRMAPEDRAQVEELLADEAFKPVRQGDLPALILDRFREKDGSAGKLVLVEPHLDSETWDPETLTGFIRTVRAAADSVAPGTPVAGQLPVASDMVEAVLRDGPRATLISLIAVVLLVIVLFREFRMIALVVSALTFGVIWIVGIVLPIGLKINFLNFIALPITFGIGVDYAVNMFQRYRLEGRGSIINVVRNTGGAVALASLTTIIGYGSLLIADNRAFVSFGQLSVLGEITCGFAAIFSLPALLRILDLRRERRKAKRQAQGRAGEAAAPATESPLRAETLAPEPQPEANTGTRTEPGPRPRLDSPTVES